MFTASMIYGLSMAMNSAGLGEGSTAAYLTCANVFHWAMGGLGYSRAAAEFAPTACAVQADLTTCLYLVSINAAGTLTVTKGTEVLTADLASGKSPLQFPALVDDKVAVGLVKVVTSGATFTMGTTDLGAGTVTDTYYNFIGLPDYRLFQA